MVTTIYSPPDIMSIINTTLATGTHYYELPDFLRAGSCGLDLLLPAAATVKAYATLDPDITESSDIATICVDISTSFLGAASLSNVHVMIIKDTPYRGRIFLQVVMASDAAIKILYCKGS